MAAIDDITALYVGYFNRAPDSAGLNFWIAQLNAGASLAGIADSFSKVPEATSLYGFLSAPLVGSSATFLSSVYLNLFGRVANATTDPAGFAYWTAQLANPAIGVGRVIQDIISGATGNDRLVTTNKTTVGKAFVTKLVDANATFNAAAAAAAFTGVTSDAATVTVAIAANDAVIVVGTETGDIAQSSASAAASVAAHTAAVAAEATAKTDADAITAALAAETAALTQAALTDAVALQVVSDAAAAAAAAAVVDNTTKQASLTDANATLTAAIAAGVVADVNSANAAVIIAQAAANTAAATVTSTAATAATSLAATTAAIADDAVSATAATAAIAAIAAGATSGAAATTAAAADVAAAAAYQTAAAATTSTTDDAAAAAAVAAAAVTSAAAAADLLVSSDAPKVKAANEALTAYNTAATAATTAATAATAANAAYDTAAAAVTSQATADAAVVLAATSTAAAATASTAATTQSSAAATLATATAATTSTADDAASVAATAAAAAAVTAAAAGVTAAASDAATASNVAAANAALTAADAALTAYNTAATAATTAATAATAANAAYDTAAAAVTSLILADAAVVLAATSTAAAATASTAATTQSSAAATLATATAATTTTADDAASVAATAAAAAAVTAAAAGVTAAASDSTAAAAVPTTFTAKTFTLTTGLDQGTAFTGGSGDDTFTGTYDGAATGSFNVADTLVGGAGTDTLNIIATDDAIVTLPGALVSGIETVKVRNVDGDATAQVLTVNASNFVGATSFNADRSTDSVTFSNLGTGAAFGVIGNGTVVGGAVVAGYATTTGAVTLNIADGTKMTNGVSITGTATSATINSTGAANTIGTVDLAQASLTSVTINAAANLKGDLLSEATDQVGASGAVTISGAATLVEFTAALDNTITTINASGLTAGGLTATLGTGTTTFTGGAGVDTVTLNTGVTSASFGLGNDVVTTADLADSLAAGVISGGDVGTDTLKVAAAADVNLAAERAAYTGFETLNNAVAATTLGADGFAGITAVITSADNSGFSGLTAGQAAAVTVTTNQTAAVTYALATATGTSDVLTVSLKNATATTSVDFLGATVNGFETVNLSSDSGVVTAVGGATTDIGFTAAANLKNINISGAFGAFVDLANTAVAVTVASTQTGTAALGITGAVVKGSSITTTANVDNITTVATAVAGVQGEFATYNAGAGDDAITTTLTALNNTNNAVASLKIEGGSGTDTLTFVAADVSFADANLQYVTGVEKITFNSTTSLSLTSGGFFDNNFKGTGVTLTAAGIANGSTATINAGSFTGATTVALTTAADGASTADNVAVTSGTGADSLTVTAASWEGAIGVAGAITATGGSGADKISVTTSTLLAVTGTNAVTINGGLGADVITAVHINASASSLGNFTYVIADGDSLAASRDTITGFDLGTAGLIADTLDLQGNPTVTTNTAGTNGTDSGTLKSHAITSGVITFDDADTFATAVVVNATNLSDALAYLAANITTAGDTVAFAYDSDSSGTADATIVFQQGTNDTVVELVGVLGTSISATNATTAGLIDLL